MKNSIDNLIGKNIRVVFCNKEKISCFVSIMGILADIPAHVDYDYQIFTGKINEYCFFNLCDVAFVDTVSDGKRPSMISVNVNSR